MRVSFREDARDYSQDTSQMPQVPKEYSEASHRDGGRGHIQRVGILRDGLSKRELQTVPSVRLRTVGKKRAAAEEGGEKRDACGYKEKPGKEKVKNSNIEIPNNKQIPIS
jgi:hypothetical protein